MLEINPVNELPFNIFVKNQLLPAKIVKINAKKCHCDVNGIFKVINSVFTLFNL